MTGRWFSPDTPVSSTIKTDCHNITATLLKVALNTITLTHNSSFNFIDVYVNFSYIFAVNLNSSSSGYYDIDVNIFRWLRSAPTYFVIDGKRYNLSDRSLYSNGSYAGNGVDEFGHFQSLRYRYYVGKTVIDCSINTYDGNFMVFEQVHIIGLGLG